MLKLQIVSDSQERILVQCTEEVKGPNFLENFQSACFETRAL